MDRVEKLEKQVALLERQVAVLFGMVDTACDIIAVQARVADSMADWLDATAKNKPNLGAHLMGAEGLARALAQIGATNAPKGIARKSDPYRRGRHELLKRLASGAPPMRELEPVHSEPSAEPSSA